MRKTALITGNSSGLGLAFTQHYLDSGWQVYGLSRRGCPARHQDLGDIKVDLADLAQVDPALDPLLDGTRQLDLVILNAGVLGEIQRLSRTPLAAIKSVMDINVWANKLILDGLIRRNIRVDQIILISSGAAVNGNKGWSAYALSKATLNMLTQLYAAEMPDSHLVALAPGLVDTAMQSYLSEQVDTDEFPSVARLVAARGTEAMPTADQAAATIADLIPTLPGQLESGSFVDIRQI